MGHLHHDEEWLPLLSAYADGECGEQEQAVVRRHLEDCARCREWLRQVRTDGEVFRRALLASAQGIDLSGRIGRGIAGMPTPERPQGQLPLGTAITRPDGAALFRLTLTETAIALAILLVQIHAGSGLFLWPASFVLPNALRAANDVKFTMVVSVLSMAIWRLGFSYLLCVRMGWGAVGVWIAMVIDWVCRVICFVARMKSGAWKTKYQA